jgi:O-antigen biosynthesis protein
MLVSFNIFKSIDQINIIGMLAILLTRNKFSDVVDFFKNICLHGIDYIKTQHLTIDYYQKLIKNENNYDIESIIKVINRFFFKPTISLILVISDDKKSQFYQETLKSIIDQFYPYWELCLYNNGLDSHETSDCLKRWGVPHDRRIKIIQAGVGLSAASVCNAALQEASGEFVVFLGEADVLSPDALYEVVRLLNAHPEAEFLYSDEDKIRADGIRLDPFFKPDWSPDLFCSLMYTGNLAVYRRATVQRLGGVRDGFGAASAYDLVLRLTEKVPPAQIFHLPRILYHTRSSEADLNRPPQGVAILDGGKTILEDYRRRNGIPGTVTDGLLQGSFRFQRSWPDNPKVSIIIPFRDKVQLTAKCVTSLISKTDYQAYEVVLVDNQSQEPQTMAYLEEIAGHPAIRLLNYDHPFNFSAINNYAVEKSDADYIVFLNNDTEVIAHTWLSAMMEHMIREEVAAVGAKLLYYDNTIQHAGVVMGITNTCGHAFRHFPADHPGYFSQLQVVRNCSAVTAACMLVKKAIFQEVGGFDQKNLPVSFNDVDLCLKILDKGYLIVWTPYAVLYHEEHSSRGDDRKLLGSSRDHYKRITAELDFIEKEWGRYINHDPYYNPNLTRLFENYGY